MNHNLALLAELEGQVQRSNRLAKPSPEPVKIVPVEQPVDWSNAHWAIKTLSLSMTPLTPEDIQKVFSTWGLKIVNL